jgi:hypothetical protein
MFHPENKCLTEIVRIEQSVSIKSETGVIFP